MASRLGGNIRMMFLLKAYFKRSGSRSSASFVPAMDDLSLSRSYSEPQFVPVGTLAFR